MRFSIVDRGDDNSKKVAETLDEFPLLLNKYGYNNITIFCNIIK